MFSSETVGLFFFVCKGSINPLLCLDSILLTVFLECFFSYKNGRAITNSRAITIKKIITFEFWLICLWFKVAELDLMLECKFLLFPESFGKVL